MTGDAGGTRDVGRKWYAGLKTEVVRVTQVGPGTRYSGETLDSGETWDSGGTRDKGGTLELGRRWDLDLVSKGSGKQVGPGT